MKLFVTIIFVLVIVRGAAAESGGESKASAGSVLNNKTFEEDTRINDLQIRADAGSLSRYSAKFSFGYAGPGVTALDSPYIPNPDNRSGDFRSNISGQMGVRYRMTSNDALYASTGLKAYATPPPGKTDTQDVSDPGLSYDHTYLIAPGVQARTGAYVKAVTNNYYRSLGETSGFGLTHIMKWTVADSRWILGLDLSVNNYLFERGYIAKDRNATDYYSNIIPSVEYKLTRSLNLNTSVNKQIVHYRKENRATTFDSTNLLSQRLGVGWAITRDVYFNPYFNFYPDELSITSTSVAFNTVFSIF